MTELPDAGIPAEISALPSEDQPPDTRRSERRTNTRTPLGG